MTSYPDLILINAPAIGWYTTVFVYRSETHARLVVSGATGVDDKLRRELGEAERDQLALLIGVLDPYKLPETDPCRRSMKDGSSWIMLTGLPDRRVDRARQVTGNPQCREVEDAARRLMALAGVSCNGRGCVVQPEVGREVEQEATGQQSRSSVRDVAVLAASAWSAAGLLTVGLLLAGDLAGNEPAE